MRIHEYGIKPDHSYWSGFIPYSVKGASDQKFFCNPVLQFAGPVRQTASKNKEWGDVFINTVNLIKT